MESSDYLMVAASFNERSKNYGKNVWHRQYAERLVELTPISPGDFVLDAGTGTGFAALAIAKRVGPSGRVLGVDVSPGMLEEAQIALSTAFVQNIELSKADATDLNQHASSTFDVVVCAASLLYMSVSKALAEWLRLLKPGGILAFSTMRKGSPLAGQLFRECAAAFGVSLNDPSEELGSQERCRLALETSGFREIGVVQETIEMSSLDLAQAWESNSRSAGHSAVRRLSLSDHEALRKRYEGLLKQAQKDDPQAISRANVLYAFGQK
jgi:ubiquinone/menaquinone biosynthesis C-methylase UbiE